MFSVGRLIENLPTYVLSTGRVALFPFWVSSCAFSRRIQTIFLKAGLVASVVDLAEEVLGLIGITVLLEPEGEDGEVANEKDGKDTEVVDAEPLVGALGGDSGGGGEDGGHEASGGGHGTLGKGGHGGLLGNGNCHEGGGVGKRAERQRVRMMLKS
jgi:hypothetical protein